MRKLLYLITAFLIASSVIGANIDLPVVIKKGHTIRNLNMADTILVLSKGSDSVYLTLDKIVSTYNYFKIREDSTLIGDTTNAGYVVLAFANSDGVSYIRRNPTTDSIQISVNGSTWYNIGSDVMATGAGDITAVGSMTSNDAFRDGTADDDWLGLGATSGRIEFDTGAAIGSADDEINFIVGRVGIGTSTPSNLSRLHISDTGAVRQIIESSNNLAGLRLKNPRSYYGLISSYTDSNKFQVYDYFNGVNRLVIDSAGNVALGIVSPAGRLDVQPSDGLGAGLPRFILDNESGSYDLRNYQYRFSSGSNYWGLLGELDDTGYMWFAAPSASAIGSHAFGSPELSIRYNGNVGVGLAYPTYKFHVSGGRLYADSAVIAGQALYDDTAIASEGEVRGIVHDSLAVFSGGSGTSDSLYINDGGSWHGSLLNNKIVIREGSGIDITKEDSTNYDAAIFSSILGTTIETGEITNQTIAGVDIDSTSNNVVFNDAYEGTQTQADSQYTTINRVRLIVDDSLDEYSLTTHTHSGYFEVDGDTSVGTSGFNTLWALKGRFDNAYEGDTAQVDSQLTTINRVKLIVEDSLDGYSLSTHSHSGYFEVDGDTAVGTSGFNTLWGLKARFDNAYEGDTAQADSQLTTINRVNLLIEDSLDEYLATAGLGTYIGDYIDSTSLDTIERAHNTIRVAGKPISSATPTDNYILKYDQALDSFMLEADAGASAGDNVKIDTGEGIVWDVTNPVFQEGTNISITNLGTDTVVISSSGSGSGSSDSLYVNDGSWLGNIINNKIVIKEGSGIAITREDSTTYDVASFATTLETTIETGEITNQTVDNDDVDSTATNFVFNDAYEGTSGEADSQYSTRAYVYRTVEDSLDSYSLTTHTHSFVDSTDKITFETVQDRVGEMVTGGTETGISVDYQDASGKLDFVVSLGTTIETGEITDQTISKNDIDSTSSNVIFNDAYEGTSGIADSQYTTINRAKLLVEDSLNEYLFDGTGIVDAANLATSSVASDELVNQTVIKDDIDSTSSNVIFNDAYEGTSAETDSQYTTINRTKLLIEDSLDNYILNTGATVTGTYDFSGGYLTDINVLTADTVMGANTITEILNDSVYFGDGTDNDYMMISFRDGTDSGGIRYNTSTNVVQYSNDNQSWSNMGTGGGSSDSLYTNTGSWLGSIINDKIVLKEGTCIDLVREDSTTYDVVRVNTSATADSLYVNDGTWLGNILNNKIVLKEGSNISFTREDSTTYDVVTIASTGGGGSLVDTGNSRDTLTYDGLAQEILRIYEDGDSTILTPGDNGHLIIKPDGRVAFDSSWSALSYVGGNFGDITSKWSFPRTQGSAEGQLLAICDSCDSAYWTASPMRQPVYVSNGPLEWSNSDESWKIKEGSQINITQADSGDYSVFYINTTDLLGTTGDNAIGDYTFNDGRYLFNTLDDSNGHDGSFWFHNRSTSGVLDGVNPWLEIGRWSGVYSYDWATRLMLDDNGFHINPSVIDTFLDSMVYSDTTGIFLDNNGRVGVGNTAPTTKFEVTGKLLATDLFEGTISQPDSQLTTINRVNLLIEDSLDEYSLSTHSHSGYFEVDGDTATGTSGFATLWGTKALFTDAYEGDTTQADSQLTTINRTKLIVEDSLDNYALTSALAAYSLTSHGHGGTYFEVDGDTATGTSGFGSLWATKAVFTDAFEGDSTVADSQLTTIKKVNVLIEDSLNEYLFDGTGTVDATNIATDAVGSDEIATSAVGTAEVNNGVLIDEDMANNALDPDKIVGDATDNDSLDYASRAATAVKDASGNTITSTYTKFTDTINTVASKNFVRDSGATGFEAVDLTLKGDLYHYGEYMQTSRIYKLDTGYLWAQNGVKALKIPQGRGAAGTKIDSQIIHPYVIYFPNGYGPEYGQTIIGKGRPAACTGDCLDSFPGSNVTLDSVVAGSPKWKYWMVYTPYPAGNQTYEDICIKVSNDNVTWVRPYAIGKAGVTLDTVWAPVPLIDTGDINVLGEVDIAHLADAFLFVDRDGTMWTGFRGVNTYPSPDSTYIIGIPSTNGIEWPIADTTYFYANDATSSDLLSPSMVVDSFGVYRLYGVKCGSAGGTDHIKCYTSSNVNSDFTSHPLTVTHTGITSYMLWHGEVRRWHENYIAMMTLTDNCSYGTITDGQLWMFVSNDGANFTKVSHPVLSSSNRVADTLSVSGHGLPVSWDSLSIYKTSFIPIENGGEDMKFGLWYSATNGAATSWYTGYTELHMAPSAATIELTPVGKSKAPTDSISLSLPQYESGSLTTYWAFVDSTNQGSDYDTVPCLGTIPQRFHADSLIFNYATSAGNDTIITLRLYAPDRSTYTGMPDSVYLVDTLNLAANSVTRNAKYINKNFQADDMVSVVFFNYLTADNAFVKASKIVLKGIYY